MVGIGFPNPFSGRRGDIPKPGFTFLGHRNGDFGIAQRDP